MTFLRSLSQSCGFTKRLRRDFCAQQRLSSAASVALKRPNVVEADVISAAARSRAADKAVVAAQEAAIKAQDAAQGAVDALGRALELSAAILQQSPRGVSVVPDLITYAALMSTCEKGTRPEGALELFWTDGYFEQRPRRAVAR